MLICILSSLPLLLLYLSRKTQAASDDWQGVQQWNDWDPTTTTAPSVYDDDFFDVDTDTLEYDPSSFGEYQSSLEHEVSVGQNDDRKLSGIEAGWLALIPGPQKKKVLRALTQYWYGSQSKTVKSYTHHHIATRMTLDDFHKVYHSPKDTGILRDVTTNLRQRYGEDFAPTQVQFDSDNRVIPSESSNILFDRKVSPEW